MKRICLLSLALFATGCEELNEFIPTVQFDSFGVNEIDFERIDVDFKFRVDNPNPVRVDLSSFSYALGLEDVPLLDGDNEDGFTLEASDASELVLPVGLAWATAWETVQATRGKDDVGFGLLGHFGFDTPLGEARIPYDESGDFPALRTPKFHFNQLRVTNLNLISTNPTATMELDLGIDNEHESSLFFDSFDYGLRLNGQPLATGLINTFEVQGDQQGELRLPIEISLLTAGTSIVNAITGGGALDVGLDANMDVDTPFGIVPLSIDEAGALNVLL